MKAVSLFSSAGIGELGLRNEGIEICVANELLEKRANCYKFLYPETKMIQGDIKLPETKNLIQNNIDKDVQLLIATPPCQGLSSIGKNKLQKDFAIDPRNYLIFDVLEIIDSYSFDYILIENVPRFLKMYFPYEGNFYTLEEILYRKYNSKYIIEIEVLDAKNYGISQTRPRAIIKMQKKGLLWRFPEIEPIIPLKDAIGDLPSIEAGEDSGIKWHYASPINERIALALKHTKPGTSALNNEVYYPKKVDGSRIKGFHNTYKRMVWNQPAPARTTYCGSVSSHNNVHPGRLLHDGTYSDARALTLLETFIVSSIPVDIKFPENTSDTFIRTIIGEAIPPQMLTKIIKGIL